MTELWTEQSVKAALGYLKTNPNCMLQIPEVRAILANERYLKKKDNISLLEGGSPFSRDKSVEHNLEGLQSLSGLDRGSTLLFSLLQTEEIQLLNRHLRCLCIGPRNEAELLALIGYGIPEDNIKGLDLISYSDFVEVGDMHNMPFADNEFDIIIAGWVLAYSTNTELATNEIIRVLRQGGLVSVGWDMSRKDKSSEKNKYAYSESAMMNKAQAHNIESTENIIEVFKRKNTYIEIISSKNASAPYDHISRRNMVAFRIHNSDQSHKIQASLYRDDFSLRILIEHLKTNNNTKYALLVEKLRQSLYRKKTNEVGNAYLEFRADYFSNKKNGIKLSEALDSGIRILSPPSYTQRYLGSGSDSNFPSSLISLESSEVSTILESIKKDGYAISPVSLSSRTVDHLINSLNMIKFTTRDNNEVKLGTYKGPGRALASTNHLVQIPEILEIGLSDPFVSIAEQFLGVTPIFENASLAYSIGCSTNLQDQNRDAQQFHRDKDRPSFLKIFVYLSDVRMNDGPHTLVKGSHCDLTENNLQDRRFTTEEIKELYGDRAISITGARGTIFFVNTHALHCGLPIISGNSRLLLCYQYSSSMLGASFKKIKPNNMRISFPNLDKLVADYPRIFQNVILK